MRNSSLLPIKGIFYKMQQLAPNKTFIEAPTGGNGATCKSCAHCPWMAMNGLEAIHSALTGNHQQVMKSMLMTTYGSKR